MEKYQAFYRDDFDPWAMRINAREHVFLYITHYGTNNLPDIYHKNSQVPYLDPSPEVMM